MPQEYLHKGGPDCLVAVVRNDADLHRITGQGWYRIPDRAIGRQLGRNALAEASALALYQTSSIRDGLPGAIELWGEIEERTLLPRRLIIPDEPAHPAADDIYHLIRLKRVERLECPIISRRPRRVTFIRTTRERLLHASDINDLIIGTPAEELLWREMRKKRGEQGEMIGELERRYFMRTQGVVMELDFTLFQSGNALGIHCSEDRPAEDTDDAPEAWRILRFSPAQIESELGRCLGEISVMAEKMRRLRIYD